MNVRSDLDAAECLARVQDVLEGDEAANNLMLGLLFRLAKEPAVQAPAGHSPAEQQDKPPPFFALVEHERQIPLVMLMTPPHNLIVYGQGDRLEAAIDVAVSYLLR